MLVSPRSHVSLGCTVYTRCYVWKILRSSTDTLHLPNTYSSVGHPLQLLVQI
ncbi:hypothetical protein VP150E351_P0238 [Vibrio phage 150E35-1]|nr:hypothetical protein VP150E351_P0238 [Vibrio phage 150E35-1]